MSWVEKQISLFLEFKWRKKLVCDC